VKQTGLNKHKYVLYVIMTIFMILFLMENIKDPWISLYCLVIITGLFVFFDIYESYNRKAMKHLILLTLPLIILIAFSTKSNNYNYLFYFLIYYLISHYSKYYKFSIVPIVYILNSYIFFMLVNDISATMRYSLNEFIAYSLIIITGILVKKVIAQNEIIQIKQNKLTVADNKIATKVNELKTAYTKAEEAIVLRERNQMAREVHDTVGHNLTMILYELEALMINKKKTGFVNENKIKSIINLVREGLVCLRECVKELKERVKSDYPEEFTLLIKRLEKNMDISIFSDLKDYDNYPKEIQKALYYIFREGVTNGIKHGKADAYVVKSFVKNNILHFIMNDNGRGTTIKEIV
jgi:signal transduction histidine kinase